MKTTNLLLMNFVLIVALMSSNTIMASGSYWENVMIFLNNLYEGLPSCDISGSLATLLAYDFGEDYGILTEKKSISTFEPEARSQVSNTNPFESTKQFPTETPESESESESSIETLTSKPSTETPVSESESSTETPTSESLQSPTSEPFTETPTKLTKSEPPQPSELPQPSEPSEAETHTSEPPQPHKSKSELPEAETYTSEPNQGAKKKETSDNEINGTSSKIIENDGWSNVAIYTTLAIGILAVSLLIFGYIQFTKSEESVDL